MNQRIVINATIKTVAPLSIKMPPAEGGRTGEFENFPLMTRGVDVTATSRKQHSFRRPHCAAFCAAP